MFNSEKRVVLSAVLPAEGGSTTYKLTRDQAIKWLEKGEVVNYVAHDTVRAVGIQPATTRDVCGDDWGQALVIKPRGRLDRKEQGEYSLEEIEAIGYDIYLIIRFDKFIWGYEGDSDPCAVVPIRGRLFAGPGETTLKEWLAD